MDDEQLVREMLCRFLRRENYVVFEASHSDAAIQILSATCIGVMLVDKRMPGRDGEWLISHAQAQFPQTAIVLATGEYVSPHLATQRRIAGYLAKPFSADAVRNAVGDAAIWHQVAARNLGRNQAQ